MKDFKFLVSINIAPEHGDESVQSIDNSKIYGDIIDVINRYISFLLRKFSGTTENNRNLLAQGYRFQVIFL